LPLETGDEKWKVVAGDEVDEGGGCESGTTYRLTIIGMDLPALTFRCEQLAEDMSGCEHVNVIVGAAVGMVFTAKQPILWGCCYVRSGD
jgi:hypothetical protein